MPPPVLAQLGAALRWPNNSNVTTRNSSSLVAKCTVPSPEVCSAFPECHEKPEKPAGFPSFLRIIDMLLISILGGGIGLLCIGNCVSCFWLSSGIASDESSGSKEAQLAQIRRRMAFADIAKVAPEGPDNLKLPRIADPKTYRAKPEIVGSSRKAVTYAFALSVVVIVVVVCTRHAILHERMVRNMQLGSLILGNQTANLMTQLKTLHSLTDFGRQWKREKSSC